MHGEEGRFLYYEGMVEEITARKRVEAELRAAKETAEAANRAKSEFLGTMSHELRTPLNAIIGFSELMAAETLGPLGVAEYKTYIADVLTSGRHLLCIISDILDFAKTESGRIALRDEPVDLPLLIEETAHVLRERAAFGGVALSLDIEPELVRPPAAVRGDETRLKQVFLNLIGNAIKFTPRGGRVDICILTRAGGEIHIVVRDNGIGMAPADLARAFEPFHQADGSLARSHEGTGLGLAICERLMRLHDGSVALMSELGRGTVVTVTILASRRVFARATEARLRA